jgi:hypothetical protein
MNVDDLTFKKGHRQPPAWEASLSWHQERRASLSESAGLTKPEIHQEFNRLLPANSKSFMRKTYTEIITMPAVKLYYKTNVQSEATFEGVIEPKGSTGYKFSGRLKVTYKLYRILERDGFVNTVRLGHGGTSDEYTYLEFKPEGAGENIFTVEGEGSRKPNETIDFRIGFNEGLSGQYDNHYSDKVTVVAGGPEQAVKPVYIDKDGLGNTQYDVRFDGTVRADGPTGFVIKGELSGYDGPGAATEQSCRLWYKAGNGSGEHVAYYCKDTPTTIKIYGTRKASDKITVAVGATSRVFNTYAYGSEITVEIPDEF